MDRTPLRSDDRPVPDEVTGRSPQAGAVSSGTTVATPAAPVDIDQQVVHAISHDLRGPSRHIQAFVDLLGEHLGGQADEVTADYLDRLGDSASALEAKLDALTRFSRLVTHCAEAREHPAAEAAATAIERLGPRIAAAGADVRVGALPTLLVDPDQLVTVFVELIDNALKFCPHGVTIRITAEALAGEHRITVADDGPGFCRRDAHAAFDLFRRFHPASVDGTGTGLAIVARIVERHGGRATIDGIRADGASVQLVFPAVAGCPLMAEPRSDG